MRSNRPSRTIPLTRDMGLAAAGFLTGLAAAQVQAHALESAGFLAGVTGLLLVATFRFSECRAIEMEDKILALEAHRRALTTQNKRLERLYRSIAETVAATLDVVPTADGLESRVPDLAVALAREAGLDEDAVIGIHTAALLHDIGRLKVPKTLWSKPGPLTEEEWEQVHSCPEQAAAWLEPVEFPWPVAEIVRAQQERWDGGGYPDGLRGADIPLGARILAVADAYEAMTSPRPYRPAMPHVAAMATLQHEAGRRFDPAIVEAFRRVAARGDFVDLAGPVDGEEIPDWTRALP